MFDKSIGLCMSRFPETWTSSTAPTATWPIACWWSSADGYTRYNRNTFFKQAFAHVLFVLTNKTSEVLNGLTAISECEAWRSSQPEGGRSTTPPRRDDDTTPRVYPPADDLRRALGHVAVGAVEDVQVSGNRYNVWSGTDVDTQAADLVKQR